MGPCCICGSETFLPFQLRIDDLMVFRCGSCGMGVVEPLPQHPLELYGDDYYLGGSPSELERGYTEYQLMAEHGVTWAASLVELIRPHGRILDVGCADGHLLKKLGSGFDRYGIEVNPKMAAQASANGITIIGNDILDTDQLGSYANSFDIITAIAVFEHVTDFRRAAENCLNLLTKDGILIFEVPLMSERNDNSVWFRTSLEHLFYPTEASISWLFEEKALGQTLVGNELIVRDYGSTYIGIVPKDRVEAVRVSDLYQQLTTAPVGSLSPKMLEARILLHVAHAGHADEEHLDRLGALPSRWWTPALIDRFARLWITDLLRLEDRQSHLKALGEAGDFHSAEASKWRDAYQALTHQVLRLEAKDTLPQIGNERRKAERLRDAVLAQREQMKLIRSARDRIQRELAGRTPEKHGLENELKQRAAQIMEQQLAQQTREKLELQRRLEQACAEKRQLEMRLVSVWASTSWRLTRPLRSIATQYLEGLQLARGLVRWVYRHTRALELQLGSGWASTSLRLTRPLSLLATQYFEGLRRARGLVSWVYQNTRVHLGVESGLLSTRNAACLKPEAVGLANRTEEIIQLELWPVNKPLVSVIVPCFNYGDFVAEAVELGTCANTEGF